MLPLKKLSVFFVVCSLIYALLIIPWPGLLDGYRAFFRTGGDVLFRSYGSNGSVSFKPLSSADHSRDTTVVLVKKKPFVRAELDITAVYLGYRPTAFLVALVVATPIPWSRRWRALLWGLILVNLFVAFRLWLKLLDEFSNANALALYEFAPHWKSLLWALVAVLVKQPETHYMVPAFIWALVTFRRGEWRTAFGLHSESSSTRPTKRHPAKT